jgi:hypothetical protein
MGRPPGGLADRNERDRRNDRDDTRHRDGIERRDAIQQSAKRAGNADGTCQSNCATQARQDAAFVRDESYDADALRFKGCTLHRRGGLPFCSVAQRGGWARTTPGWLPLPSRSTRTLWERIARRLNGWAPVTSASAKRQLPSGRTVAVFLARTVASRPIRGAAETR